VKRFLDDEAATTALADEVLAALPCDCAGWTLLLSGELGAGKSTFARALIKAAGHQGAVPSPTYTLVEPYNLAAGNIYHIDLYRISDPEELRYLGWSELDDGLRLVEWPQRAPDLIHEADLALQLEYAGDGRQASLQGLSERGSALIQKIK
jgi:tRNA threonylcarbamoyladenosine biosynthesis protein TsaE